MSETHTPDRDASDRDAHIAGRTCTHLADTHT